MNPKTQQLDLDELQQRLSLWEKQYGMTSAECEQRYFTGALGDDQEIIRWIHDYHSYRILLSALKPRKAVGA